jgi:tripartite-type tricarboxylate transporter receptor subunit TctC
MAIDRREFLTMAAAGLASGLTLPGLAWAADEWPNRNLRVIVPYPAGGSSDIIGRAISVPLGERLKQTVIVDNRPGANGNLGASMVAQAKEDGHTVLLCDVGALAISPSVYTKLNFDPSADLRGVSMLAYSPHVLAVHPSVPANTLAELVALSYKERLNFAVTAIGSAPHLAGVAVQLATKARWDYVPYKGGSQAITDTIGGQTQIIMNGMLATLPHIRSGKLKAIAISKRERMSLVPDIPTIAEQGVTDFESGTWQGMMAPTSMPESHRKALAAMLQEVMNLPKVKSNLNEQGAEIVIKDPAELDRFFNSERDRWAAVVKAADIRLD